MPHRASRVRDVRVSLGASITPLAAICVASVIAAGCGAGDGAMPAPPLHSGGHQLTTPISHVVILIMENRSLNYMFNGFPGTFTVTSGTTHTGRVVQLQQIALN